MRLDSRTSRASSPATTSWCWISMGPCTQGEREGWVLWELLAVRGPRKSSRRHSSIGSRSTSRAGADVAVRGRPSPARRRGLTMTSRSPTARPIRCPTARRPGSAGRASPPASRAPHDRARALVSCSSSCWCVECRCPVCAACSRPAQPRAAADRPRADPVHDLPPRTARQVRCTRRVADAWPFSPRSVPAAGAGDGTPAARPPSGVAPGAGRFRRRGVRPRVARDR